MASSLYLNYSIVHSNAEKKNPKTANPRAVPNTFLRSFLIDYLVEYLLLPKSISLLSTALVKRPRSNPMPYPPNVTMIDLRTQFVSRGE